MIFDRGKFWHLCLYEIYSKFKISGELLKECVMKQHSKFKGQGNNSRFNAISVKKWNKRSINYNIVVRSRKFNNGPRERLSSSNQRGLRLIQLSSKYWGIRSEWWTQRWSKKSWFQLCFASKGLLDIGYTDANIYHICA